VDRLKPALQTGATAAPGATASSDEGTWTWEAPIVPTSATARAGAATGGAATGGAVGGGAVGGGAARSGTVGKGSLGFVQAPLPPAVLDESQPSFADLRVLGPDGQAVPHLVRFPSRAGGQALAWKPVTLVNPVYQPGEYARATLDFGQATLKNQIKIAVSGTNFRRRAMVEGSTDGAAWDRLADDLYLFAIDLPDHKEIRVDTLHLPSNDFRYLRLTVYQMADDRERIEIESAATAFIEPRKATRTELPHPPATVSRDDEKHETRVEVDLGFRHLSLDGMRFDIRDAHFYRGYVLEGRDSLTETVATSTETGPVEKERETPWLRLRDGVLYRIVNGAQTSESLEMSDMRFPARYLRLRILDQDNAPLDVAPDGVVVWWRQPSLVFEPPVAGACVLRWGNPNAHAPQYDLAEAHPDLAITELPVVTLGEPRLLAPPPPPPQAPWSERHRGIMLGLLAVVAAGLAVFAARSLRALRAQGQGGAEGRGSA
jgi:hypothetical protein